VNRKSLRRDLRAEATIPTLLRHHIRAGAKQISDWVFDLESDLISVLISRLAVEPE
jgi:hypothetical protein